MEEKKSGKGKVILIIIIAIIAVIAIALAVGQGGSNGGSDQDNAPAIAQTDAEICSAVYAYAMENQKYEPEGDYTYVRTEEDTSIEYSEDGACVAAVVVKEAYNGELEGGGWCDFYWFNKTTGEIKYLTGAQDFDPSWVDMATGDFQGPED